MTGTAIGGKAAAAIFELADLAATSRFAAGIAAALQPGDVVALSGMLGSGKTTLARAILAALGHVGEVPSPSFAIVEQYEPPQVRLRIAHADFYRLTDPVQIAEIGLDDYRQDAALIAEWPEHAGGFAHEAACLAITLEIAPGGEGEGCETVGERRYAIVEAGPDWVLRDPWTSR